VLPDLAVEDSTCSLLRLRTAKDGRASAMER
jgi:hypothetical protein